MATLPDKTTRASVEQTGRLQRRMEGVGLAIGAIADSEPDIFLHLQVLCATCEYPDLCERNLRDISAAPGWEDYCPNAVLLSALSELRLFRATV
jgi:hypothetical protein